MEDYNKTVSEGLKKIEVGMARLENAEASMKEEFFKLIYNTYPRQAETLWKTKSYGKAVFFMEHTIKWWESKWGVEPDDIEKRNRLNELRSDLAYYYVDAQRKDMTGKAIQYAKMGLQTGIHTNDINRIENYLYVIMKFSKLPEDKREWMQIYESYKNDINALDWVLNNEEKEEYQKYYENLSKDPNISLP
jgi:hypothetical protein